MPSSREDFFDGPLPDTVVPFRLQEILYNDDFYRDYLLHRRNLEVSSRREPSVTRDLQRTARVREEDLILLRKPHFVGGIVVEPTYSKTEETNTTTSTTTTVRTTSTTRKSQFETSKKGSTWVNEQGKRFLKRPRTETFPDDCCDENSMSSYGSVDSCLRKRYNYNVTNSEDLVFDACSMIRKSQITNVNKYYGYIESSRVPIIIGDKPTVLKEILPNFISESIIHECWIIRASRNRKMKTDRNYYGYVVRNSKSLSILEDQLMGFTKILEMVGLANHCGI